MLYQNKINSISVNLIQGVSLVKLRVLLLLAQKEFMGIMKGQIKLCIDAIMESFANGDMLVERLIATKLYLRGIHREKFQSDTPDDPVILARLKDIERDLEKLFLR